MKYIDMHCDTIMKVPDNGSSDLLIENPLAGVDFKRMRAGNAMSQFFAMFLMSDEIFVEEGKKIITDDEYISNSVKLLKEAVVNCDYIEMAYNYEDLIKNNNNNKMSAFLTIEDGRSAKSVEKIQEYYDLGVRLIGLTWNFENCIGYPTSDDKEIMNKGLKKYGFDAVEYMNHIGMIVDVSHLSDAGFYDVAKISKKPFVASHSNARELSPHRRNLTDDMIRIIANKGGVAGLNFAPAFLNKDIANQNSRIELMVEHLNYVKNIGGEDVLALGSDLDGVEGKLEINSTDKMPNLFEALRKDGWSENLIEKFAYRNVSRLIKDTL